MADWLQNTFGLRGGGSPIQIQGGGGKLDKKLKQALYAWVEKQVS